MSDVDLRLVRFLDAFRISFRILDLIHAELHDACARIIQGSDALAPALLRCWSFVDVVHRAREMAQAVPGLGRRCAERNSFLEDTKIADRFRNYIQHLRSELPKPVLDPFPFWGSLSWVDPDDPNCCHVAIAGAITKETKFAGCVFDTVERRWVSRVSLSVAELSFNFDPIYESSTKFREFIEPWLHDRLGGKVLVKSDLPVISMRVVQGVRGDV
jgi:hypothetical protein